MGDSDWDTLEEAQLRSALGYDEFEVLPDPPVNHDGHAYMAAVSVWRASSDDIRGILRFAADCALRAEQPAVVWDFRGDGSAYDATAKPRAIAVVGVTWLDG